jgi:hypothetical protein
MEADEPDKKLMIIVPIGPPLAAPPTVAPPPTTNWHADCVVPGLCEGYFATWYSRIKQSLRNRKLLHIAEKPSDCTTSDPAKYVALITQNQGAVAVIIDAVDPGFLVR